MRNCLVLIWMKLVLVSGIENDDVDTAIAGAIFVRIVQRYGMILREAGSGKTRSVKVVAENEKLYEICGARGGEFPVRIEMLIVDGDIVCVALDAKGFAAGDEDSGETVDGALGRWANGGGAAFVEADFTQADYDAFGSSGYGDHVLINFRSQSFQ